MCGGPWSSVRRSVTDDILFLCGCSPCGGILFLRIVDGTCIIWGENHTLFGAVPFFQRSVRQASVVLCCGVTGAGSTTGCSTDLSALRLPIFSPGSDHSCPPLFLYTWCLQGLSLRAQRANPTPFSSVAPLCEDLRTWLPSHCWVRHLSSWLLFTDFVELFYPMMPSLFFALVDWYLSLLFTIIHWGLVMIRRQQVNGCAWCSIFIHR